MATAKQIAWRKEFARRAKAGELKKKPRASKRRVFKGSRETWEGTGPTGYERKKNPAKKKAPAVKRAGVSPTAYVKRASQATKAPPSKRLKARRKIAVSGKAPKGYFPNPPKREAMKCAVQTSRDKVTWKTLARFGLLSDAKAYAQAIARTAKLHDSYIRVTYDGK